MPIPPRTICSLGATPPSLPRTLPGMICGRARIAPALRALARKSRRLSESFCLRIIDLLFENYPVAVMIRCFILALHAYGYRRNCSRIMEDRLRACLQEFPAVTADQICRRSWSLAVGRPPQHREI